MSGLLFPTLLGLGWNIVRAPRWHTGLQTALSGKTSTIAYQAYPLKHWELNFRLLREVGAAGYTSATSELLQIVGLFNAVQGRFDSWLYNDPDFNAVTAQSFGTGDGSTNAFQLIATYENSGGPGYSEIIQNLNGVPTLYDNGTAIPSANYAIGATGLVTFGSGHTPASGHALTWSGGFYYRCRFDEDTLDVSKFMSKLWELKKIAFSEVLL